MAWYWVSFTTYLIMCTVTLILAQINERTALFWATGIVYPIGYVLFYPIRAWNIWKMCHGYYKKNGIKFWQYLLGKRVKE